MQTKTSVSLLKQILSENKKKIKNTKIKELKRSQLKNTLISYSFIGKFYFRFKWQSKICFPTHLDK